MLLLAPWLLLTAFTPPPEAAVAELYYRVGAGRPLRARPSDAPLSLIRGELRDLRGEPLAEVAIRARHWRSDAVLSQTRSDARGAFTLSLPPSDSVISPVVQFEKPGFTSIDGVSWPLHYPVRPYLLVREPRQVHDALLTVTDPDERLWWALELVDQASELDGGASDLALFPNLEPALPELRLIARSSVFSAQDRQSSSPASRARALLEVWGEPADQAPSRLLRLGELRGADPLAVCELHRAAFGRAQGAPEAQSTSCADRVAYSDDGGRARALYTWYRDSMASVVELVMVKTGEQWVLQSAMVREVFCTTCHD